MLNNSLFIKLSAERVFLVESEAGLIIEFEDIIAFVILIFICINRII